MPGLNNVCGGFVNGARVVGRHAAGKEREGEGLSCYGHAEHVLEGDSVESELEACLFVGDSVCPTGRDNDGL